MAYRKTAPKGIYRITCLPTGRFYIGSGVSIPGRWHNHFSELRNGIHHSIQLQRAWNKYGESNFTFEVLEYVLIPEMLTAREQYYLDTLQPFGKRGYNTSRIAGSPLGVRHTPEARANMSRAAKGKVLKPETREKIRQARLGKKASPESRAKMSDAQRGKPGHWTGRKHTPESRKKMSESRRALGIKNTPEHIEKSRQAKIGNHYALGRKHTDEERARMKANNTRRLTLIVTDPQGKVYIVNGVTEFASEHGLQHSHLLEVAQGKAKQHKGWTARYPLPDEL